MSAQVTSLPIEAERALFEGQIETLVTCCYQNERPLHGLAGILDWRFRGALSSFLQKGVMSGEKGECVYIPIQGRGRTYRLILIGAGPSSHPGERPPLADSAYEILQKNLRSLNPSKVGISSADFGGITEEQVKKRFKGSTLFLLQ